jgi:catechol 2,3-dioxygenase-like lactoylglutathione lyase family enzyme
MIRVTDLDHFVLRVKDLERALGFYRDVLGLPVLFLDAFHAGLRPFVSVQIGGQLLDLVPDPSFDAEAGAAAGGYLHCCIRVAGPLEETIAELKEKGVELLEEAPAVRMGATGFGRSIYTRDPDGYMVEFKEEVAE